MQTFDEHMAHVAECQQRAKTAPNENAQQSWLALADSWRHTAESASSSSANQTSCKKPPKGYGNCTQ